MVLASSHRNGVFGFSEIIRNLEQSTERTQHRHPEADRPDADVGRFQSVYGSHRARSVIGSALGILPGGGAVIASFAAYTFEKKWSKHPERFGRGAIEGVAAPESANNAAAQTSFIHC